MKEEIPPLGDVFDLMRLIWGVNRGLELSSKRMKSRLGVTGPQRLALRIIGRFPRITGAELSVILHLDRSTTSTLVSGLAKKKLVAQQVDHSDKRRILLTLTEMGRKLDVPSPDTIEAVVTRLIGEASRAELDYASRLLRKLGEALRGEAAKNAERSSTAA